MARKLTERDMEYLRDAVFGYLNGFNDVGENEYPKLTVDELVEYGYDTIAFDREQGDPRAQAIYFCGKEAIMEACRRIVLEDGEFSEVCTDWNA